MAARELVFDIFAIDRASAVFSKVGASAEMSGERAKKGGKVLAEGLLGAGAVALGLGIKAMKMSGDFEAAITRLETTAGESHKALSAVGQGLLDMAGRVGYTAQELATGMYTVESAGFHGAAGLAVMSAAAKGARVEGADLTTVTDAVTSLLVDYHLKASDAAMVTNTLTAAVGHGKTTFEGLASALPNVAAAGASAHISMSELSAAVATMTMHGTDAAKAGTYLRQVIGQLESPSAKARMVMKGLGIDANQLGLTLSSGSGHGLADAIQMVDDGIRKHLQPSGLVAIDTFRKSAGSASDYQKMLANLPPAYTTTFGALSQMVGGVKSLQGFLQLGGANLKTYKSNVAAVRAQVAAGGKDVAGYAEQQQTLNGKIADAKGAFSALMVELGQKLTPAAKGAMDKVSALIGYLAAHQQAVMKVGAAVLALSSALLVAKLAMVAWNVASFAGSVIMGVWSGAMAVLRGAMVAMTVVTNLETAAVWLMNAALDANPILLIVMAIGALVVALILAYKHFGSFRAVAVAAVDAIGAAFTWLWNNAFAPALRFILNGLAWLEEGIGGVLHALGKIPGFGWAKTAGDRMDAAARAARGMANAIHNIPQTHPINIAVNAYLTPQYIAVMRQVNAAHASNIRTSMGFPGHNATGTPYWRGGGTWVGENGPEYLDLPAGSRIRTQQQVGTQPDSGGGTTINLTVNGAIDPRGTAQTILDALRQYKRESGVALGLG